MLSDPKYQRLNAGERSCWVTLLCLGSIDDGIVKHCEEQYLISHSGIDVMDLGKYHGILVKFEMLGLITKGRDEKGAEYIQIKNWQKRQEVYSESRERVKRWRERQSVTPVTLRGNARIEENRIDKKRIENTGVKTPLNTGIRESGDISTVLEKTRDRLKESGVI